MLLKIKNNLSWNILCKTANVLDIMRLQIKSVNYVCLCTCTFALWASQFASYQLFSKEIC